MQSAPAATAYPELLKEIDPNLTYESRIKKLRHVLKSLEGRLQEHLDTSESVLYYQQNKEDRRIKEVGIRDGRSRQDVIRILRDLLGRGFRG